MSDVAPTAADVVARLIEDRLTIAVAESLTGGLLVAEFISTPGASAVVLGGVVAYQRELKSTLLDVDRELLAKHGAVHPDVAAAMARGVRRRLAVDGHDADVGISTTGVAGPDPQDGHQVGTVFLGLSMGGETSVRSLILRGDRESIRRETVACAVSWLDEALERGLT